MTTAVQTVQQIPLRQIVANYNDRTIFNTEDLKALAASMASNGLLQPITVRPLTGGLFEVVAGGRRFRAAGLLGWATIPALVRTLTDEDAARLMLTENTGRADLDPIDEGTAYQMRMATFGWTLTQTAQEAGRSVAHVAGRLKLLTLREDLQALVRTGNLKIGYAQCVTELDRNFQALAVDRLNGNPSPSISWFKGVCSDLLTAQAQQPLFALGGDFTGTVLPLVAMAPMVDPPLPGKQQPPKHGANIREMIAGQITFWQEAARAWQARGKPHHRNACIAAVQSLEGAMQAAGWATA